MKTTVFYYYISRADSNRSFDLTNIYGGTLFLGRNWHQIKHKT